MALALLRSGFRGRNQGSLCRLILLGQRTSVASSIQLHFDVPGGSLLLLEGGRFFHASVVSTDSQEEKSPRKPYEGWKNLASENFQQGHRRYYVDLKQDDLLNSFVKISEVKDGRRNSILLSVDDVKKFIDEFLRLTKESENTAEKDPGSKPEDKVAFVYCSFKTGKFFELRLSENKFGKYICIVEQYFDFNSKVKKKQILLEIEGAEKLIRCVDQVYTRSKTA